MNLSTLPFNPWIIVLLGLLGLWGLFKVVRAGAPVVVKPIHRAIVFLRILAFAALILAVLDPFWRSRKPDPNAYRLAVLVDASASMETRDLPGDIGRLEFVADWLVPDSGEPALQALADPRTPVEVHLFSSDLEAWDGSPPSSPIPGQTAIGDALEAVRKGADDGSRRPLGGVLLLSDGGNISGVSPARAAARYKQEGIPVSVIGVGQQIETGDLEVAFDQTELTFTEGEPASITVTLTNRFKDGDSGRLDLYRGEELVTQQAVGLEAGETRQVEVNLDPGTAGIETFRAVYSPDKKRGNPATNVSYSIARIERDGNHRLLLMSGRAGWESRFLRLMAMESGTVTMDSLIRIDEGRYIKLSRTESGTDPAANRVADRQTLEALPDSDDFYLSYDAILIDTAMLSEESESIGQILSEFAGTKGGGLLLYPRSDISNTDFQLPATVREIFPARDFTARRLQSAVPLDFESNPLYTDQVAGPLFSGPDPEIPAGARLSVPATLSRAALVQANTESGGIPVLVTQAYGAGRTAWLAGDFLWRWRLSSDRASEQYAAFWQGLLSWLAVGGKERLVAPVNARILPVEKETRMDIRLLGADYTPRMDASVSAVVTGPDGGILERRLLPDVEQPGHYTLSLPLSKPGPYRVDYEALFPDGDRVVRTSWFAVASTGAESRQTAFQEKALRDIARVTGGSYRSFNEWDELAPIPVSASIPLVDHEAHWTRSILFLLAAMTFFLLEWWLRRRHGLR